jgi:cytochrome o ubiquinol oxidase subunit 2
MFHWISLHILTGVVSPRGSIAAQQLHLLIIAVSLMSIVVIPVIGMTIGFAWKYRASNTHARYRPEWSNNLTLEVIWWIIPICIIAVLGTLTYISSHELDPYRPIVTEVPPITIQVVALDWKWLFIYPDQNIATVNTITIPVHTPVQFQITADAPMNSFWIPQLGGQIFAMAGMNTRLSLIADMLGTYRGSSANFSGDGFSDMHFSVNVVDPEHYRDWIEHVRASGIALSKARYTQLLNPDTVDGFQYYGLVEPGLFTTIYAKPMTPSHTTDSSGIIMNMHM